MNIAAAVGSGAVGLVLSPLMHGIISRTPIHQSTLSGPHCRTCGAPISGVQRHSLAATIWKRHRCETCGNRIWPQSPWIELATIALLALAGLRLGWGPALPAYLLFFFSGLAITFVDLRTYIIPNRIIYPTLWALLTLLTAAAAVHSNWGALESALIGMAAAWLFFFVVWFAYPKGMGFGDVRLSALVGLMAGGIGLRYVAIALLGGLLLGSFVGFLLISVRVRSRQQAIPFGPFLFAGAVIAILFGPAISPPPT